jgi:2-polyprenyl-6-hydroxyphenyl methylase/3-demethylubiquinone-9 3-methyltransferase
VEDIMSKVTYGHHWKEYSAGEVRQYFKAMSDDFNITINPYSYKDYDLKSPYLMFKLLSKLGNLTKIFADELQVIVHLEKKASWKIKTPDY